MSETDIRASLSVTSAHPLDLGDPSAWYRVSRSYVDVFAVAGDPRTQRRTALLRLETGALLCGIGAVVTDDGTTVRFFAAGGPDSEVEPLAAGSTVTRALADGWCEALRQAVNAPRTGGLQDAAAATAELAPLLAARALASRRMPGADDWRERRRRHGEALTADALAGLVASGGGAALARGAIPTAGDPLKAALLALMSAQAVTPRIEAFEAPAPDATVASRLQAVLARHEMISRPVLLRPGWTRQPGPPMLGYLGPERRPVALLHAGGRWVIRDGAEVRPIASDAMEGSGDGGLASDALQLYPALPARPLRFRDLFVFGFATLAADRVRLVLLMLATAVLAMLVPYGSRFLISNAIPYGDIGLTGVIIGGLIAAALARTVFEAGKALTMLRAELGFEGRLQPALLLRLLRLPPAFFRGFAVGDITDRVLGIQSARQVITEAFSSAAASSVFSLISLIPILTVDWRLALLALALALVLGGVNAFVSYRGLIHERRRLAEKGRLDSFVVQMLMGVGKLRAAASERMGFARWSQLFARNIGHTVAAGRWANWQATLDALLPQLATLTLYATIVYLMKADALKGGTAPSFSLADFVTVTTAFAQVLAAISALAGALTQSLTAIPLIERAEPIIASVPDTPPVDSRPVTLEGTIDIRNVSFRYTETAPLALNELSLRITRGEFVAIVGASGSGKSTLLRLLLGFDRPELGDIFYDGHSLSRLDLSDLRRQIGVVLQHGRIMAGSIHANIAGESGLGLDEALEAARLVGLDRDIEQMPMGMHTVLLDGGGTLSGGQRQRILIARALVQKPAVLMLDEATSALDNRTQAIVTETLASLPVTRLVIAHRLSTIEKVDRIVMLERGKVVETGTFSELMQKGGVFAAHARRQLV
ncbi:NHLP bacteriocin export ABC transporter permease/ATPase subunit [Microvirga tunisiensis]|uniref:NHLP bacteriocin export ABC transporter permease/ATPase subunit n=1 Tax=Pannonibacter tanglangensis TaxID=2750084 RepID=A0A7X5J9X7_9HYPH|nr:NHLP bacteriocin export ABC transporter permease/ATPase subunit [Pannonibacter sp. XCT-53]NBN79952.1 NHLP bacteriocin export ABC transporter permease/ATPase subunit [Pannonibacter sp. XCT-53]